MITKSASAPPTVTKKPEFLVIGAQKCASTWLYQCLREHPQICMPAHKREHQYLGSEFFKDDPGAYFDLFDRAGADQRIGDASVEYLFDQRAAERVAAELGNPLVIALLRNPVDRALSAFHWYVRKSVLPDVEPGVVLEAVLESVRTDGTHPQRDLLDRGRYAEQLQRYVDAVGVENVLVVMYDQVRKDPRGVLQDVFTRLGVNADFRPPSIESRPKVNTYSRLTTLIERTFPPRLDGRGFMWRVAAHLSQQLNQRVLARRSSQARPEIAPALRARLAEYFRQDNQRLVSLLGTVRVIGDPTSPSRWA